LTNHCSRDTPTFVHPRSGAQGIVDRASDASDGYKILPSV
jgi:hypothetical protein